MSRRPPRSTRTATHFPDTSLFRSKHHRTGLRIDLRDDGIGELLPAFALMRRGLAHLYCQNAVQKQYTLTRPMLKKAVTRRRNTQVALQFLVDVDQGRRRPHAGLYGKAKPVGLAAGMIGEIGRASCWGKSGSVRLD